jgi:hypothetical protein
MKRHNRNPCKECREDLEEWEIEICEGCGMGRIREGGNASTVTWTAPYEDDDAPEAQWK